MTMAGDRADVDDRAAALLFEVRQHVFAGQEQAFQIGCDHPVPVAFFKLYRTAETKDPNIVVQDIDVAKGGEGCFDAAGYIGRYTDVRDHHLALCAFGTNDVARFNSGRFVAIHRHH